MFHVCISGVLHPCFLNMVKTEPCVFRKCHQASLHMCDRRTTSLCPLLQQGRYKLGHCCVAGLPRHSHRFRRWVVSPLRRGTNGDPNPINMYRVVFRTYIKFDDYARTVFFETFIDGRQELPSTTPLARVFLCAISLTETVKK